MLDVFAYLFTKSPASGTAASRRILYKAARHGAAPRRANESRWFSLDALTGEPDGRLLDEVIRTDERNRILHFCMDEMNPDTGRFCISPILKA